jgi:hypothetical protein
MAAWNALFKRLTIGFGVLGGRKIQTQVPILIPG